MRIPKVNSVNPQPAPTKTAPQLDSLAYYNPATKIITTLECINSLFPSNSSESKLKSSQVPKDLQKSTRKAKFIHPDSTKSLILSNRALSGHIRSSGYELPLKEINANSPISNPLCCSKETSLNSEPQPKSAHFPPNSSLQHSKSLPPSSLPSPIFSLFQKPQIAPEIHSTQFPQVFCIEALSEDESDSFSASTLHPPVGLLSIFSLFLKPITSIDTCPKPLAPESVMFLYDSVSLVDSDCESSEDLGSSSYVLC
jgi:hypothetical protein